MVMDIVNIWRTEHWGWTLIPLSFSLSLCINCENHSNKEIAGDYNQLLLFRVFNEVDSEGKKNHIDDINVA